MHWLVPPSVFQLTVTPWDSSTKLWVPWTDLSQGLFQLDPVLWGQNPRHLPKAMLHLPPVGGLGFIFQHPKLRTVYVCPWLPQSHTVPHQGAGPPSSQHPSASSEEILPPQVPSWGPHRPMPDSFRYWWKPKGFPASLYEGANLSQLN